MHSAQLHGNNDDGLLKERSQLKKMLGDQAYYDFVEKGSLKLQRRVSEIVKHVDFNRETSDQSVMGAIDHFKAKNSSINDKAPTGFLTARQKQIVKTDDGFRTSMNLPAASHGVSEEAQLEHFS